MKILSLCFWTVFAVTFLGRADAGVIPYSLIQKEVETAKTEKVKTCRDLEKQHSELLQKIEKLRNEEERYLAEIENMGKDYCPTAR